MNEKSGEKYQNSLGCKCKIKVDREHDRLTWTLWIWWIVWFIESLGRRRWTSSTFIRRRCDSSHCWWNALQILWKRKDENGINQSLCTCNDRYYAYFLHHLLMRCSWRQENLWMRSLLLNNTLQCKHFTETHTKIERIIAMTHDLQLAKLTTTAPTHSNLHLSFCCCCFFRLSSSLSTFFSRKNSCCFSFRNSSRREFNIWICSFVSPSVMASWRSRSSRSLRKRSSSTSASCSA